MAAATLTNTEYYLVLFVLWLFSTFFLYRFLRKSSSRRRRLPPSPPSLPIIGHLHLLTLEYHKSIQRIAAKYGPLLYLRFAFLPAVLVSSPTLAADIFKNLDVTLSGKPKSPFEVLFGNSGFITSQYGDYWKFMKKLCMTELLGARQIHRSKGIREEELSRFVAKIQKKASENEEVNVGEELMELTNVIICRMAMSTRTSEDDGEAKMCRELVLGSLNLAGKTKLASVLGPYKKIALLLYGKQAVEVMARADEFFERILKEHEEKDSSGEKKEDKDLMDILLEVHRDENAEVKISRSHIKAFISDLFVAGTSTVADTMQFALAELINHPKAFVKVREEIETVVGTQRLVQESDISNLHYLQAVVKETLRLYAPLAAIPRATMEDCEIGGYDIPAGTLVLTNAYSMMRDPTVWENPDEFVPERFLESSSYSKDNNMMNNFSYFPFGMGRRSCPGQTLAMAATSVSVAAMVQCFDWKYVGGGDGVGEKVNMEIGRTITTSMKHPLVCVPRVHFNPFPVA